MARRVAKRCDLTAMYIPGYHWNGSRRCDGIAVIKGIFEDGSQRLMCLPHGRQVRWHGYEGKTAKLETVEPFPTLADAIDCILGKPEKFISLSCRDNEHDVCRVDYGQRVCICGCDHEFAGTGDDDFLEED